MVVDQGSQTGHSSPSHHGRGRRLRRRSPASLADLGGARLRSGERFVARFGAGCSLGLKAAGLSACLYEDEASAASPGGGVGGGPQRGLCQPGRRAQQEIKDAVRHGAAAQVPDLVSTCVDLRPPGPGFAA